MEHIIDGRLLAPPEPLEQTLAALDTLAPGDSLALLLHCRPNPLFNILRQSGFVWEESVADDGTLTIRIRHRST